MRPSLGVRRSERRPTLSSALPAAVHGLSRLCLSNDGGGLTARYQPWGHACGSPGHSLHETDRVHRRDTAPATTRLSREPPTPTLDTLSRPVGGSGPRAPSHDSDPSRSRPFAPGAPDGSDGRPALASTAGSGVRY